MSEILKDRLRQLANDEFPAAARAGKYPIVFNHCMLRVVYDNLFQDKWQRVLAKGRPAIHQLTESQLFVAIAIAEKIMNDRQACVILNEQSVRWRKKE